MPRPPMPCLSARHDRATAQGRPCPACHRAADGIVRLDAGFSVAMQRILDGALRARRWTPTREHVALFGVEFERAAEAA